MENSKDFICGSVKTLMYIVTGMSILLALHLITSSRPKHLTSKGVLCFSANRPPVRRVDLTKDASNRPVQIVSIRSHLLPPINANCVLFSSADRLPVRRIDFKNSYSFCSFSNVSLSSNDYFQVIILILIYYIVQ